MIWSINSGAYLIACSSQVPVIDNENLKNEFCKERGLREDEDKKNDQLRCVLNDRQQKLRCLNNDYSRMKNAHEKMTEERNMYQMDWILRDSTA